MALNDTIKQLKTLLANIQHDMEKADKGNKAASQRIRTGTVKLEKVAKLYRKESIKAEKQNKGQKKPAKKAAPKAAAKKAAPKAAAKKAAPKAKAKAHGSKARAFSVKRPTAKLPTRRAAI